MYKMGLVLSYLKARNPIKGHWGHIKKTKSQREEVPTGQRRYILSISKARIAVDWTASIFTSKYEFTRGEKVKTKQNKN